MNNVNEPRIGDTLRMALTLCDDVSGKLVESVEGGYVIEIQRDDSFKAVKKGQRLTLPKSALVEFSSN